MSAPAKKQDAQPGTHRFYNKSLERWVIKVLPGQQLITREEDEIIATVLGSCVAACIWDPEVGVGGLNHFMLPHDDEGLWSGASLALRYGNHAMDSLINALIKAGAEKHRMQCKFFGGGNVISGMSGVGDKNSRFAREYAEIERLNVVTFDLGGTQGRRIMFDPTTGRAWRKLLDPNAGLSIVNQEKHLIKPAKPAASAGSIELF